MKLLLLLFLLLSLVATLSGLKILLYSPRYELSHVNFLGRIADVLVEERMDVVAFLPKMNPFITTNGTKFARTLAVEADQRVDAVMSNMTVDAAFWEDKPASDFLDEKASLDATRMLHAQQCEYTLNQTHVVQFLRNQKFDLGISEYFDQCGLGLFELIGLEKHVLAQSSLLPERVAQIFGAPNVPSMVPAYLGENSVRMGYVERAVNLFKQNFGIWWTNSVASATQTAIEKATGRKIDLEKKMAEASFVFVNSDPLLLDFPRPTTERIVNIGGITVPKPKPLDAYWEEVMKKRPSTVLLSFGSVAQSYTMPEAMKKAVLEAFARFPEVTFIWKYEKDEDRVAEGVANVVTNKWVPQNDLLAHPNLKLFITHAGMNSILESVSSAVPMLIVPLSADQSRNAQNVLRFRIARQLTKSDLFKSAILESNIREMLRNETYGANASRLSKMIAKRPRDQRDQLVKHVRFAAEFSSLPEHRSPQLSFVQYYMLDIVIPLIITVIALTVAFGFVTVCLFKCIFCRKPKKIKLF